MSDGMKGLLIGSVVGALAAWSQWQGDPGTALRLLIVSAAIGFAIGYFIGKRRSA
jgi:hypothetical protein